MAALRFPPELLVKAQGTGLAIKLAIFDGLSMQILDQVETPNRVVIAFMMGGRQVGAYVSPLGSVPPTGRDVQVRTIDVLAIEDGRVSAIWVVADDLGLLTQLDAVNLAHQG